MVIVFMLTGILTGLLAAAASLGLGQSLPLAGAAYALGGSAGLGLGVAVRMRRDALVRNLKRAVRRLVPRHAA